MIYDIINEQYTKPEKPVRDSLDEDDEYNAKVAKWQSQCDQIDRKIIREAKMAKPDLLKYKTELVYPEIQKPDTVEATKKAQQQEAEIAEMQKADKEAYSKLSPQDVTMVFKFNDEASKLAFDISFVPDKESFGKVVENASDLQKHLLSYYDKDGNPDRIRYAKDLYAGQNIEKIVTEAIVQATNQTKAWFLKNQKNIGDGTQRNFVLPPTTDIDRLRQQVFGKTA